MLKLEHEFTLRKEELEKDIILNWHYRIPVNFK